MKSVQQNIIIQSGIDRHRITSIESKQRLLLNIEGRANVKVTVIKVTVN